jgi:hypothetical protein
MQQQLTALHEQAQPDAMHVWNHATLSRGNGMNTESGMLGVLL